jgi:5-methyltetrahydropteroyltriglutamate--homocysteine methyltransferase
MTTQTSLDAIRSDQVGSLLRPQALLDAYARYDEGQAPEEDVRQAQDGAVKAAIARQEAIGLPVVSDGEFRRRGFQDSFGEAVSGFAGARRTTVREEVERHSQTQTPGRIESGLERPGPAIGSRLPVEERLQLVRNIILDEYKAASAIASTPVKVTLIGPDRISQRFQWEHEQSKAVYPDMDAFLRDVVDIERRMVGEVISAGCKYVQIDAPGYTAYVDPPLLERMRSRGEDPLSNMDRSIAADNAVIADFPGVTFGIHVCRGNGRSMWHREGAYDAIAERLFTGLNHQRLLLEYDTERAGGFEPLRFVPKGKIAVLGLVTTKNGTVESEEALRRRIDEAGRYLPVEQLALSPQCGFASGLMGNLLTEDDQWRKLELIQRLSEKVWG